MFFKLLQTIFFSLAASTTAFAQQAQTQAPVAATGNIGLFKSETTCSRTYIYKNRTYPVDSSRKLDAEGLRVVFKKNPETEAMLNDYQSKLKASLIPAYAVTLGVASIIGGGVFYAKTVASEPGNRDTRLAFIIPGAFLVVAGFGYSLYAIAAKEKVLEKAVQTYNDSAPLIEKIRVGLTPLPSGTGGAVITTVPFH